MAASKLHFATAKKVAADRTILARDLFLVEAEEIGLEMLNNAKALIITKAAVGAAEIFYKEALATEEGYQKHLLAQYEEEEAKERPSE